jgi:oxygen-independent coproporphyrinogen-3 oxidase
VIPIATAGPEPAAAGRQALKALPPLALYVHVPWCVRKCPYCDFNSHEARGELSDGAYIDALIADLEAALPQVWGRPVSSIFIGGGTPSLLSGAAVDRLLAAVRARMPLFPEAEITLEANPGTAEADKFAAFRAAGVNRLSLGIQSFDDAHLAALGRIHTAIDARRAIDFAQRHFDNINLDLMYALPGQTLAGAKHDIETAAAFGTSHLSAYHLTLEPNTAFHHAPPPELPDDDLAADMQIMIEEALSAAGFEHYETSAFACPGRRCRHNLNYWNFGDYLGIGAGAHSKISLPERILREARPRHPSDYLDDPASRDWREVTAADLPFEFMMNALRLIEGFDPARFEERTGLPLAMLGERLNAARREGLLDASPTRIAPTAQGARFLNRLLGIFLD